MRMHSNSIVIERPLAYNSIEQSHALKSEPGEYEKGFIPDAANIPLSKIDQITTAKDTPIFVYCLRGRRSKKAVKKLIKMGYTNVKGIGSIKKYIGQRAK